MPGSTSTALGLRLVYRGARGTISVEEAAKPDPGRSAAQQKIGDHDHVVIQLDHKDADAGELDIADCTTKHVVASLWAEFEDGTKLEASIDSDLKKP